MRKFMSLAILMALVGFVGCDENKETCPVDNADSHSAPVTPVTPVTSEPVQVD